MQDLKVTQNHYPILWLGLNKSDNRIVESTIWLKVNNYRNIENRFGVFVFSNLLFRVIYIGKAGAGEMLDCINESILSGKANGSCQIKALYTSSYAKADSLEKDLIKEYKPFNNIIGDKMTF